MGTGYCHLGDVRVGTHKGTHPIGPCWHGLVSCVFLVQRLLNNQAKVFLPVPAVGAGTRILGQYGVTSDAILVEGTVAQAPSPPKPWKSCYSQPGVGRRPNSRDGLSISGGRKTQRYWTRSSV